jgi:hypothetical protein
MPLKKSADTAALCSEARKRKLKFSDAVSVIHHHILRNDVAMLVANKKKQKPQFNSPCEATMRAPDDRDKGRKKLCAPNHRIMMIGS